eukprot:COSAG06_NODE_21522_length_754_cov_1.044275_2_plen_207_part_01
MALIESTMTSKAAAQDPITAAMVFFLAKAVPPPDGVFGGNPVGFGTAIHQHTSRLRSAIATLEDPDERYECTMLAYNCEHALDCALMAQRPSDPDVWWDKEYGPNACTIAECLRLYDYDRAHNMLIDRFNIDVVVTMPGCALAPSLHWGNVALVQELVDIALPSVRRAFADGMEGAPTEQRECFTYSIMLPSWPLWAYHAEMLSDRQ